MKYLARFIMWLAGWKYKGELPAEKKAVIISVPHTSNWDFFWGELAFLSQGIPAFILMKKEFFFFPLGMILRALNVIPVDRGNKDSQLVEQMITEFKQRDSMYLCITPEGSRKKRKKWKKGFWLLRKRQVFRFIWAASIIKENIVKWGLCFIRRRMWMLI